MLRNPVDVMYSQHSQLVFNQREDLTDFGRGARGRARPARRPARFRPMPSARRRSSTATVVRFPEQVRRYLEVFGAAAVHFVVFDDLVADAGGGLPRRRSSSWASIPT